MEIIGGIPFSKRAFTFHAMKSPHLIYAILLSIPGESAIYHPSTEMNYSVVETAPAKSQAIDPPKKPRKQRQMFYKGKGTFGLLLTLALGPIGYASIHIFSHNLTMRDKAKNGMMIWIGAVLIGGYIAYAIQSRQSVAQLIGEFILGILENAG